VVLRGAGVDETIIEGNNLDTVFHVVSSNPAVHFTDATLEDLTIRGGDGSGDPLTGVGGIYANGTLFLDRVHVSQNRGGARGAGGVYADFDLTIRDSVIEGNSSGDAGTGGVRAADGAVMESTTVSDNSATGSLGVGGLSVTGSADLSDVTITGNTASGENGTGGLRLSDGEDFSLEEVRITNNSATADYGVGGFSDVADVTATNLDISSNQGGRYGEGGALIACCQGRLSLTNATVSTNTARDSSGGGLWNDGEATLVNVTISGNVAGDGSSGGLYNSGDLSLTYVTIAYNTGSTQDGGGLLNDGDLKIASSIVSGNEPYECGQGRQSIESQGGNVDAGGSCGFGEATDHTGVGDALLSPLADNGGFSATHGLLPGSPAIDAANGCPAPAEDQRRQHRPSGPGCDAGAFELQGPDEPVWGNVDCAEGVSISDVSFMLAFVAGAIRDPISCGLAIGATVTFAGVPRVWGDDDCDGSVSAGDALFVLRWLMSVPVQPMDNCPSIGQLSG
jgi:hypothetical protein